jgi:hypothetical protein
MTDADVFVGRVLVVVEVHDREPQRRQRQRVAERGERETSADGRQLDETLIERPGRDGDGGSPAAPDRCAARLGSVDAGFS